MSNPQYPPPGQPLNYQTPSPPPRPVDDGKLTGVDWLLCIFCSGIGCIIGIIRIVQGKKSGPAMVGISILFAIIWTVVRFVITMSQHH